MKIKTVEEFINFWLEHVIRGNVRQSTYMAYRGYINNHVLEWLGIVNIAALNPEMLQNFVATLQGKALAGKTIHSILFMLRCALACALEYNYILYNPCTKLRLPKVEQKEVCIFDSHEQKRLEKAIVTSQDERCYGVLISLYTGMRIGELCGLKWKSVDFEHNTLEIKNSLNRVITYENGTKKTIILETSPKTKKSCRIIPLPMFLSVLLKEMKSRSKSEYVISMKNGKAVEPRMMQIIYTKLLKMSNIEFLSFHALRHTFATRAIESGADVKTVSEILGHANTMITVNLYTHSLFEQKQKLMEKMNLIYRR